MALRFQATRKNFSNIADKKQFFYGSPGIFCILGIVATFASLLVYGRILLPLPNMVSNVGALGVGKVGGVRILLLYLTSCIVSSIIQGSTISHFP